MKKLVKRLVNYSDTNSFASKLRRKRLTPLINLIEECHKEYGKVNLIDIGGTQTYWNILPNNLLEKRNIHITIVNLPGSNKPEDNENFSFVEADGCDLSMFGNKEFHIAHSNSVIEHVGNWSKIEKFAGELSRVAEKFFIQTPNYWFPVEPHCMTPLFHWFPKPFRIWLVNNFNLGSWEREESIGGAVRMVESINLLNKRMMRELFADADIKTERFLLFPKSFMAIKKSSI